MLTGFIFGAIKKSRDNKLTGCTSSHGKEKGRVEALFARYELYPRVENRFVRECFLIYTEIDKQPDWLTHFAARCNDVLFGRAPAAAEEGVRVHVHSVDRSGVAEDHQAASL